MSTFNKENLGEYGKCQNSVLPSSIEGSFSRLTTMSSYRSRRTSDVCMFQSNKYFDEMNTYLSPLAIDWSIENQIIIKFKKQIISFEYSEMRVVQPLDTIEGQQYVDPI